jgi:hypothetical protein
VFKTYAWEPVEFLLRRVLYWVGMRYPDHVARVTSRCPCLSSNARSQPERSDRLNDVVGPSEKG